MWGGWLLAIVTRTNGPTSKERNDYVRLRLDRGEVADNDASKLDRDTKDQKSSKRQKSRATLAPDEI